MWYAATVAAPGTEPVTLAAAKAQFRGESTDEDTLVQSWIAAARAHLENRCGVRFASRTGVELKCDSFADFSTLPEAPVTAVASITYVDTEGATQTLAGTVYEARLEGIEPHIVLKYNQTWPAIQSGSRITVTATIGYATVPEEIVHAMNLIIAHWDMNREAASETSVQQIPLGVDALIENHRRFA